MKSKQFCKPKNIGVQLSPKQLTALDEVAKLRGITRNELMRQATLREIVNFKNTEQLGHLFQREVDWMAAGIVNIIRAQANSQIIFSKEDFIEHRVMVLTDTAKAGGWYLLEMLVKKIRKDLQVDGPFLSSSNLGK